MPLGYGVQWNHILLKKKEKTVNFLILLRKHLTAQNCSETNLLLKKLKQNFNVFLSKKHFDLLSHSQLPS
jgi:hypothetical protein